MGTLGLPLGTFAVIEGTEHQTSKGTATGGWYSGDFVVETINGKKLDHEIGIWTDWPSQLPDKRISGKRYVLHGYEGGEWVGQPDGLPHDEPLGWTQGGRFVYDPRFAVTSVEKVDGVTVADARPLDPNVPLAKSDFAVKTVHSRPIGLLGLPLGTFAIIQVHLPKGPPTMEIPILIDTVNGERMKSPRHISIPDFTFPKDTEQVTLRGFETGRWSGTPFSPKSEFPSTATVPQMDNSFGFHNEFVLTTPVKSGG